MGRATESRTVRVEIDRVFQEEHDKKLDMFKFQEHDAIEKRDAYYELKEKRDAIFVDYDALETEKKAIDKAIDMMKSVLHIFGSLVVLELIALARRIPPMNVVNVAMTAHTSVQPRTFLNEYPNVTVMLFENRLAKFLKPTHVNSEFGGRCCWS